MSPRFRYSTLAWIPVWLGALGFLLWTNGERANRIERVSILTGAVPAADASSPTGYAGGVRQLLIPEHNHDSMQWIVQTQQMLKDGEWRVRHVNYDNAPAGREVRSAAPYRWWLGLIAWFHHRVGSSSLAGSVERAALWADPILHLVLLTGGVWYVARQFGSLPASLIAIGVAGLFPLSSAFVSGQPDDRGLALACAIGSVLPMIAALRSRGESSQTAVRRAFLIAGIIGGLGVWINPTSQLPVLAGIALGGLVATWCTRPTDAAMAGTAWPWRTWAVAGAATSLAGTLVEFFPGHMDFTAWRLDMGHPVYAVAWLGLGEILARYTSWVRGDKPVWNRRSVAIAGLATLAVVAVPVAVVLVPGRGFLTATSFAQRLSKLPGSAEAENVLTWLLDHAASAATWATLLPLLLVVPAAALLKRERARTDERDLRPSPTSGGTHHSGGKRAGAHGEAPLVHGTVRHRDSEASMAAPRDNVNQRAAIALTFGPLAVSLAFACCQLRWWSTVDGMLLVLLVASMPAVFPGSITRFRIWSWPVATALVLLPGFLQLWPETVEGEADAVTAIEVQSMIERDLAHWLATRTEPDGAVVFAPPDLTAALLYYGGLRGLGTPYRENEDGFNASVRLAAASSPDEGQAVATNREVTHILLPTWDRYLDEYARLGSKQPEFSLIGMLHRWQAPRWLRPVPYQVPAIPGFPAQSVAIFEVVEMQDNATALSRLAEYFVEMGLGAQAASVGRALEQCFPTDLGALVARAQVALARHDGPGMAEVMKSLLPALERGDDFELPWDRRVSLAFVLEQVKKTDLARTQIQRCIDELDEIRLRTMSALSLLRLLRAGKSFGIEPADPNLRELGPTLLPVEMRERL